MYITDREWQPLQLFLRRVLVEQTEQLANTAFVDAEAAERAQEQQISNNQLKYTIIIISSLPMLIAYPFFQKYFVQGVMLGSAKGMIPGFVAHAAGVSGLKYLGGAI